MAEEQDEDIIGPSDEEGSQAVEYIGNIMPSFIHATCHLSLEF